MTNLKISQLTSISAADIVDTDEVAVVDSSVPRTKRASISNLRSAILKYEYDDYAAMDAETATLPDESIVSLKKEGFSYQFGTAGDSAFDLDSAPTGYTSQITGSSQPVVALALGDKYFHPAQFGDIDSLTATQMTTLLRLMLDKASVEQREVVIPARATDYEYDGVLFAPQHKGVRIHLEGTLSNTQATVGTAQSAINLGNHHPAYGNQTGSNHVTWYTVGTVSQDDHQVTLDSGSNRTSGVAAITVGARVMVRGVNHYLGAGSHERPLYLRWAHVLDVDAGTGVITLDRVIPFPMGTALIALADDSAVTGADASRRLFGTSGLWIEGPGGFKSLGNAFARGGSLDLHMHVGFIEAKTGLFFNSIQDADIYIERLKVTGKMIDIAGGSYNVRARVGSAFVEGTQNDSALAVVNENSEKITVEFDDFSAPDFAGTQGGFGMLYTRKSKFIFNGPCYMPNAVGSPISFSNAAATVSGTQVQPLTHDNTFEFRAGGSFGTGIARFFYGVDAGGECKRNKIIARGRFEGTPSTGYAGQLIGTDNEIYGGSWENGSLLISTTTPGCKVRDSHFDEGIVYSGVDRHDFDVANVTSDGWLAAKAALTQAVGISSENPTTSGDDYASVAFPADSLENNDVITLEWDVVVSGTTDAKTVQIHDGTGAVVTSSFAAGDTGLAWNKVEITIHADAAYNALTFDQDGAIAAFRRTGLTLSSSGLTLEFQRWVDNASDSLVVRRLRTSISRYGHV